MRAKNEREGMIWKINRKKVCNEEIFYYPDIQEDAKIEKGLMNSGNIQRITRRNKWGWKAKRSRFGAIHFHIPTRGT